MASRFVSLTSQLVWHIRIVTKTTIHLSVGESGGHLPPNR